MTFAEKMARLYERFAFAGKGGTNPHFNYRFVQEARLKRELNRACRDLGLILDNFELKYDGDPKRGVCQLSFDIGEAKADEDGNVEFVTLCGVGGGMDSSDKAPQKALVAAMKYAILTGLSVETGEDSEADGAPDAAEAQRLRDALAGAASLDAVVALKADVGAFQGSDLFEGLRAAYYDATRRFETK